MADQKRDYYEVLGVAKTATEQEIKAAYKKMAIKYHPDRQGDKSEAEKKEAEAKFKEAAEAYDVLHDPQKRQRYDQFGFAGVGGAAGGGYQNMSMDDIFSQFGDIFSDLFGGGASFSSFGGGFGFGGGGRGQRKPQHRGGDLRLKVRLTLKECATGVTKKFKVRKKVTCTHCHGTGAENSTGDKQTCSTCHGAGYVLRSQRSVFGMMQTQSVCPDCGGEGTIIKNKCHLCGGTGVTTGDEVVEVKIPAGVQDGMVLTVNGKGDAAIHGGIPGDIQVFIEVEQDKDFIRQDNDLIYNLLIDVPTAALGGSVEVPTLDGKVKLKIEPGTQPGKVLRLRGKGLPFLQGYGYGNGDLIVNISVYIPQTLTREEKQALEKMQQSDNFRPNQSAKSSIFNRFKQMFE
ncbi:MAG: molecular chaperone DnaJ [Bacteroidaceae bacterium]|nr:molecular chaperone DnaJ [Bacteroidaceae bacterium]